jgi:hypothetical protein
VDQGTCEPPCYSARGLCRLCSMPCHTAVPPPMQPHAVHAGGPRCAMPPACACAATANAGDKRRMQQQAAAAHAEMSQRCAVHDVTCAHACSYPPEAVCLRPCRTAETASAAPGPGCRRLIRTLVRSGACRRQGRTATLSAGRACGRIVACLSARRGLRGVQPAYTSTCLIGMNHERLMQVSCATTRAPSGPVRPQQLTHSA